MIGFLLVIVVPLLILFGSFPLFSSFCKQVGIKPSPWHGFIPLVVLGVYFSSLMIGFFLTITPIYLMLISYALVFKKKKRFWGWFWRSSLLLGLYVWLLNGISLFFLDPKYYEFKNQCSQLPQPQIYNQEYWDIYIDWHSLKFQADTEKHLFFFDSKKLDKKLYGNLWKTQHTSKETSWGTISTDEQYYDDIHFATTTTYSYPTHTFLIYTGLNNRDFSFRYREEIWECKNYTRKNGNGA